MPYLWINAQFETACGHRFLYTFAIRGIASGISAPFIVIDQTAYLIGWPPGILFASTKSIIIHFLWIKTPNVTRVKIVFNL